ncbi:patatin-like phospholipase/acyl hydrolase [Anaerobacterium chartisolvens]|uniref:Patatin-like phospholipase/acyl hydrolase n=1 Tax=Anaerobacterium chartisolvens TaxID=1297424 RepID=A0A369AQ49_9FIRM|nr:patatin-like phospholipase family protein [Anaerobacterium chartisolvens]RCX09584.1 patatin-like phospholipase/acyl hydrolase [Anaerobacterium chartisolvens]
MYKIICFDGGGIKGALTAKMLEMLNNVIPGMLKNVSMYAGTSTGGIISLGLALGITPDNIVQLYAENGQEIFDPYYKFEIQRIDNGIGAPKYNNVKLKKLLEDNFKDNPPLKDLPCNILINTFSLNLDGFSWYPVQLTNFPGSPYLDVTTVDAALRTSAAPVYFPSYQGFIDGGVFANNPSIGALCNALDPEKANADMNSVRLLSFGTGFNPSCIKHDVKWGAAEWLNPMGNPPIPLLSILMDGVMEVDDYNCRQILGEDKYCRANIRLDKSFSMDNWKDVDYLIECAESFPLKNPQEWDRIVSWISRNF